MLLSLTLHSTQSFRSKFQNVSGPFSQSPQVGDVWQYIARLVEGE
jgi:hypothetical protein